MLKKDSQAEARERIKEKLKNGEVTDFSTQPASSQHQPLKYQNQRLSRGRRISHNAL